MIHALSREASTADIQAEVREQQLGLAARFATTRILTWLRRRAYPREGFQRLARESDFKTAKVTKTGLGLEVRLSRQPGRASALAP